MLDKVLMNDGRRWVPLPGCISPLPSQRLVQTSQARHNFAADHPRNFVAPGSGLAILWEAVCHQSLGITCSCLACKRSEACLTTFERHRVYFRKVAGSFSCRTCEKVVSMLPFKATLNYLFYFKRRHVLALPWRVGIKQRKTTTGPAIRRLNV